MKSAIPNSFRLLTLAFLLSFSSISARPSITPTDISNDGNPTALTGMPVEKSEDQTKEFDFYVSPNPSVGNTLSLRFTNVAAGNAQVKIFNLIGREMYATVISLNGTDDFTTTIDLPKGLLAGAYLVTVSANNAVCTKRFIVR